MNTKEYIESGILEAYVLGALTERELADVEANIALYPELKAEVATIEKAMEQYAESISQPPPAFLQEQIWNEINKDNADAATEVPASAPRTIPFTPPTKNTNWARAAVWAALVGSLVANFSLWSERNRMHGEQLAMQSHMDSLQQQQARLAQVINDYHTEGDMIADSNTQTIVMKSLKPGHPMAATVYWNKNKGAAYVSMKKLPMPPAGMQYQMWVIQDGKPVSMGVLDNGMVQSPSVALLKMQVNNGQAFAISLEKEGGSSTPTAENIYVLGKVS